MVRFENKLWVYYSLYIYIAGECLWLFYSRIRGTEREYMHVGNKDLLIGFRSPSYTYLNHYEAKCLDRLANSHPSLGLLNRFLQLIFHVKHVIEISNDFITTSKIIMGTMEQKRTTQLFIPVSKYKFRNHHRWLQPMFNTLRYGYDSFKCIGSKLWYSLPSHLKLQLI